MSLEETGHVSLIEVTPRSGKETLGTWWFLRQARAWLDKTEHINRSQGQGRRYEQTLRRRGVRAPALAKLNHFAKPDWPARFAR